LSEVGLWKTIHKLEKAFREYNPPPGRLLEFQSRDHSNRHMPFPIGGPLEPSLHLQPFSRYLAPTNVSEQTNQGASYQTQWITVPAGGGDQFWEQRYIRYY